MRVSEFHFVLRDLKRKKGKKKKGEKGEKPWEGGALSGSAGESFPKMVWVAVIAQKKRRGEREKKRGRGVGLFPTEEERRERTDQGKRE